MKDVLSSKKFWAFVVAVLAAVAVFIAAAVWDVKDSVVMGTQGLIGTLTTLYHQAQASVDRAQANSPYYPSGGSYPPQPGPPPPP